MVIRKENFLTLPQGYKLPSKEEVKGKDYCKYHYVWTHYNNYYWAFRNLIQNKINKGVLKFLDKSEMSMLINEDLFPLVAPINATRIDLKARLKNGKSEK